MVGGTQTPQPQQHPQTLTTTATSEEEALKRNTDCVYFLASPLTCKKGAECEYRHSDTARLNPRDCWFWLNGSCLNPKCAFRHPPLDGLLGTPASTPTGSSLSSSQIVPIPVTSAYNSGKQAVPCIFFQQGFCLKGDRCPFFHAPPSTGINKKLIPPRPAATNTSEPLSLKKPFGGLEKCSRELNFPQINVPKSRDLTHGTPQAKVEEAAPTKNGISFNRYSAQPPLLDDEPPRYRRPTDIITPDTNGDSMSRSHRVQQVLATDDHDVLNSRETGEFSREPSPGFDVLVDNELGESDYYHNEDHHYGRSGSHDYDIDRSADYDLADNVDRDTYRDLRRYDSYEQMQEQYGRDNSRASSERMVGVGSADVERSRYPRGGSPDRIVDLRHHLSKQRKVNGLRSVISHDYMRDSHVDRSHRGSSRSDQHDLVTPKESSVVSNRLRGRIKLPRRSLSPVNGSDLRTEMEMERGRNWAPQVSSIHHGRLGDRIKGRAQDEIRNEGRSFRGPRMRETVNENISYFAGPKSLAELKKDGKIAENKEQHMNNNDRLSLSLGKRKYSILENPQQSESDVLFEGPKPLSEILKKKKVAETTVSGNSLVSGNKDDNNRKEEEESLTINKEERKLANVIEVKMEGMIVEEPVEDHEPETFDQRDGQFDYEQIYGEDDNLDEAENAEGEEEYFDDDDGDDFANKIGVMFS